MAQRYCQFLRPPKKGLDAYPSFLFHQPSYFLCFLCFLCDKSNPCALRNFCYFLYFFDLKVRSVALQSAGPNISPQTSDIFLLTSNIAFYATGTGQWHHSFCISPRPTPVNLSSCLYDAPLSFNSFNTILFDLSSST